MRKNIALLFLLILATLFSGCSLLEGVMGIREPKVIVNSTKIGEITSQSITIILTLDVENPTPADLMLASLKTGVQIEGKDMLTVDTPLAGKVLHPGMGNMIAVNIEIPISVLGDLAEILTSSKEEVQLTLNNTLVFSSTLPLSATFTLNKSIPLPKLPQFSISAPSVSFKNLTTLRISFDINAKNPGKIPYKGIEINGAFFVNGEQLSELTSMMNIAALSTSSSAVAVDVGLLSLGSSIVKTLKSGNFTPQFKGTLKTPLGVTAVEF
ncbi:hypothetical protein KAU32_00470 [bacterium]|nr:hypothetical protein [bacterium]